MDMNPKSCQEKKWYYQAEDGIRYCPMLRACVYQDPGDTREAELHSAADRTPDAPDGKSLYRMPRCTLPDRL
ncbi:hypothetical protein JW898_05735 [Candidatus Woesearchaeota archaeon]|nr:hypothetical protein [Candidatus Woesearchaeota archaeon]